MAIDLIEFGDGRTANTPTSATNLNANFGALRAALEEQGIDAAEALALAHAAATSVQFVTRVDGLGVSTTVQTGWWIKADESFAYFDDQGAGPQHPTDLPAEQWFDVEGNLYTRALPGAAS